MHRKPPPNHRAGCKDACLLRSCCCSRCQRRTPPNGPLRSPVRADSLLESRVSCRMHKTAASENSRSRTGSLWTRTCQATKHLEITIHVPDNGPPSITAPNRDLRRMPAASCTTSARDNAAKKLVDMRDQGKTASSHQHGPLCQWLILALYWSQYSIEGLEVYPPCPPQLHPH